MSFPLFGKRVIPEKGKAVEKHRHDVHDRKQDFGETLGEMKERRHTISLETTVKYCLNQSKEISPYQNRINDGTMLFYCVTDTGHGGRLSFHVIFSKFECGYISEHTNTEPL